MKLIFSAGLDKTTPPLPAEQSSIVGERYVGTLGLMEELEVRLGLAGRWPEARERLFAYLVALEMAA